MRRALKFIGLAMIVLIPAGMIYEILGERADKKRLPQIGRSIDIGGRTLNIFCSGSQSPTVIFDSGAGQPGYVWSPIQQIVAKSNRACWFDRAGLGWSDEGPFPRTAVVTSRDLHELLQRAHISPPYVLVGHSLGGLNARVFAGMHRKEVAGLVLVDAAHEDEPRRAPSFMLGKTAPRWAWHPLWTIAHVAKTIGLLRLIAPRVNFPRDPSQASRDQILAALRAQPKSVATLFDPSGPDSYAQAERSGNFGALPLIVLTRGKLDTNPHPSEMDRQFNAYTQVWMHEIQPKLARLSSIGEQVIVNASGHDIPNEAPEAVIDAITKVILRARQVPPAAFQNRDQNQALTGTKNPSKNDLNPM